MRTVPLLLVVLLVGCPKQTASTTESAASQGSQVSVGEGQSEMHDRLEQLTGARDALVAGDADGARAVMRTLSEETSPGLAPEGWQAPLQDLVEAAVTGSEANTSEEVGAAIAEAGRACGSCHRAAGLGPYFLDVPVPAEDDVMGRHVWADDRMWESLVGANDGAWVRARDVLGPVDERATHLYDDVPLAVRAEAAQYRSRLHGLAEAGVTGGDSERASIYGGVLETCVGCHSLLGGGPHAEPEGDAP